MIGAASSIIKNEVQGTWPWLGKRWFEISWSEQADRMITLQRALKTSRRSQELNVWKVKEKSVKNEIGVGH